MNNMKALTEKTLTNNNEVTSIGLKSLLTARYIEVYINFHYQKRWPFWHLRVIEISCNQAALQIIRLRACSLRKAYMCFFIEAAFV